MAYTYTHKKSDGSITKEKGSFVEKAMASMTEACVELKNERSKRREVYTYDDNPEKSVLLYEQAVLSNNEDLVTFKGLLKVMEDLE